MLCSARCIFHFSCLTELHHFCDCCTIGSNLVRFQYTSATWWHQCVELSVINMMDMLSHLHKHWNDSRHWKPLLYSWPIKNTCCQRQDFVGQGILNVTWKPFAFFFPLDCYRRWMTSCSMIFWFSTVSVIHLKVVQVFAFMHGHMGHKKCTTSWKS